MLNLPIDANVLEILCDNWKDMFIVSIKVRIDRLRGTNGWLALLNYVY